MSSTLYSTVSAHGLPPSDCLSLYASPLTLSTRLLGVTVTRFASIAHLSPLAIRPYLGILRPLFRIPSCDFRLAALAPSHRRLLLLASSATHGCVFCTAHVACLGDALAGSKLQQCIRAGRVLDDVQEHADQEIRDLANDVCAFPAKVPDASRRRFENRFGRAAYFEAAAMLAFMGWLNFNLDALGMTLESEIAPFAQLLLAPRALPFDVTDIVADDGNDALGRRRASYVASPEAATWWRRAIAYVTNAWGFLAMLPHVARATAVEAQWYAGIPYAIDEIAEWQRREMGCELQFDREMEIADVKRAAAFACREVFLKDENSKWNRADKFALMYVFGKAVGNAVVVEDAVSLAGAHREKDDTSSFSSASTEGDMLSLETVAEDVRKELNEVFAMAASEEKPTDAFSAAARFVFSAAGPAGQVSKAGTTKDFVAYVDDPASQMDVIGMIGLFALMHRMALMCGGK